MKYKTLLKFLFVFLIFSACEVKWDMEISFEEDLSGSYSIAVLIDQEAPGQPPSIKDTPRLSNNFAISSLSFTEGEIPSC